MGDTSAVVWDEAAATFDLAADHGLTDPGVREVWTALMERALPPAPSRVADLGCGTGSMAILAAELGHRVDGVDYSEQMLVRARAKSVPGVEFSLGDAGHPRLAAGTYDAVFCRHVLWALPDPAAALTRWAALLRPHGRLVLVEGRWSTGGGLESAQIVALLGDLGYATKVVPLDDQRYWGRPIQDERYLIMAEAVAVTGQSSAD